MNDPVLDMLTRVRDRPALYLGQHSAEALFLFLAGYVAAVGDLTARDTSGYGAFVEGLYAKYGYGGGGHSWAWVLGQAAGGGRGRAGSVLRGAGGVPAKARRTSRCTGPGGHESFLRAIAHGCPPGR